MNHVVDENIETTEPKTKCKLCLQKRIRFTCNACIEKGDFYHSKPEYSDRFQEKRILFLQHKIQSDELAKKFEDTKQLTIIADQLQTEIFNKKQRIVWLKELISKSNTNSLKIHDLITKLNCSNKKSIRLLDSFKVRVDDASELTEKHEGEVSKINEENLIVHKKLQIEIQSHINRMYHLIFPITESVSKVDADPPSDSQTERITALADATRTAYVRGQWILQDSHSEKSHVIVASSLPSNGNYSAYTDWIAKFKGIGIHNQDANEYGLSQNPAYRISAALTYTSQFVSLLSFFLDVRLPFTTNYTDFCRKELSETDFLRRVARLNANILFLCYQQCINIGQLQPEHTLANLLLLLNNLNGQLGYVGPVDSNNAPLTSPGLMTLPNLEPADDSDTEDANIQNDWEAVPDSSCLESLPQAQDFHTNSVQLQQATSITGGLMNNIKSLVINSWRK